MWKDYQSKFTPRQYMVSGDFELFYYNDVSLTRVAPHEHDYYEFYFFIEGNIVCRIHDKDYPIAPGDLMLIPPHTPHQAFIEYQGSHYRRFVLWISTDYFDALHALSPDYDYLIRLASEKQQYIFHNDAVTFNALQSRLIHILEEVHTERFGREALIRAALDELIMTLNRTFYERQEAAPQKHAASLCEDVLNYIEGHLSEDLSLDALSRVFYVSKYHISHIFKERFGLSLHQYVIKKRLDMCRRQILSSRNITQTCQQSGFQNYSGFYRAFLKEYGISPKEYLKSHTRPEHIPL